MDGASQDDMAVDVKVEMSAVSPEDLAVKASSTPIHQGPRHEELNRQAGSGAV